MKEQTIRIINPCAAITIRDEQLPDSGSTILTLSKDRSDLRLFFAWLALIAFLLLVVGSFTWVNTVSAQSGGGYDLSWSTVDGGGHTWSTGSGYSLGGAIGQPDAQSPASGSGYSLQGGFWHEHCAPVAVPVDIACEGTQVRLTWTPAAANMAYDIYRDTGPYLVPDPTRKVGTDSDGLWLDPLADTCGDVASNYYYQVRSTCTGAHADANPCAEFDFGLVLGSN